MKCQFNRNAVFLATACCDVTIVMLQCEPSRLLPVLQDTPYIFDLNEGNCDSIFGMEDLRVVYRSLQQIEQLLQGY